MKYKNENTQINIEKKCCCWSKQVYFDKFTSQTKLIKCEYF